MGTKDIHGEEFTEETLMKLDIFEKYLESWLPVFINQKRVDEINIFDLFAGPGEDPIGQTGSPIRILDVISKYQPQIQIRKCKINVILNDKDKKKAEQLKGEVESYKKEKLNSLNEYINVEVHSEDFSSIFFKYVEGRFQTTPNLFFLDQNGIKEITNEVFKKLESLQRTDFMFFISSSFVNRFGTTSSFKKYFPKIKSTKYFEIHRDLLNYYRSLLSTNSRLMLYPFSIKKGCNIYGLIFGSHHPLGVGKFLSIAWDKNKINGEANFDIDEDKKKEQQTLPLFEPVKLTKIEKFESELRDYILSRQKISNKEIYDFAIGNGHIPKHAKKLLEQLKKEDRINHYQYDKISYVNCYKNKEIIYFTIKK